MKRRILIVDGEPMVLAAVKGLLRMAQRQWDMEFAGSGIEPPALMANALFDAVVSNVRMSLVNGAQLPCEPAYFYPKQCALRSRAKGPVT